METEVMTVAQAADYLRVSEGTVRNWTSRRRIPFVKVGGRTCFLKTDLDKWLAAHRVPAGAGA